MIKKKIGVLFGGCSTEYPVSLQSAYAILSHVPEEKYEIMKIGITREGSWFLYHGALSQIAQDTWHTDAAHCVPVLISPNRKLHGLVSLTKEGIKETSLDAAFPVLHGKNGEDGTLQGLLELSNIPIIGCNTLSSALCMDKNRARKLVQAAGIAVPKAALLKSFLTEEALFSLTSSLSYPLFVKPVRAGSSFGITKIYSADNLSAAVGLALKHDSEVLIEEAVEGFETGCAILGNDNLTLGRVDEIELTQGFFDYTEKYTLKSAKIHMPARIDAETERRLKETGAAIYKILGCTGFARVDLFLTPHKQIVFNEVNTIPGFTAHSRYPNMMKGIGLSFEEVLERLIELGLN